MKVLAVIFKTANPYRATRGFRGFQIIASGLAAFFHGGIDGQKTWGSLKIIPRKEPFYLFFKKEPVRNIRLARFLVDLFLYGLIISVVGGKRRTRGIDPVSQTVHPLLV
ncbi:hypothetical protein BACCIP111895_00321 [Neobacillus rhizosphaerae]|uniref:RDD domain-containing protein n=1 Tax=Neobacillus rhizosphaerae TaxID=2880965 RepID=A0ABM9EKS0_9BACI|nr:inorganic phosphate transporter [Neobacillus rhizosphaerae]CAH2713186.1 hypothetical protein BACCIP111895_00321 [Neobacillus rhizosphaerae]